MGGSRGGLTTKIHALVDGRGSQLQLTLTPSPAGDCPEAAQLLGRLRPGTIVLADKAYDAEASPGHRRWKASFSRTLYRERNRVERFFNRIKHFRRVATRYEKHAANYLAMLKLTDTPVCLRNPVHQTGQR